MKKSAVLEGNYLILKGGFGAPGTIRTCDQLVRSQLLYPAELRAQNWDFMKAAMVRLYG